MILYGVTTKHSWLTFFGISLPLIMTLFTLSFKEVKGDPNQRTNIPRKIREEVFERQKGMCAVPGCNANGGILELHHKIPLKNGGSDNPTNLVYLCPNHHTQAHIILEA